MRAICNMAALFIAASAMICLASSPASARDPLAGQVTIYRDNFGVPHIVGLSEEATFFGYGYAQAQDHLERMMLQYMDAEGRLSEVLGPRALGQGYLHFIPYEYRWDGDYLQRLLRTYQTVIDKRRKIDLQTYKVLSGFARGVNEYIAEHRARIPNWIQPITPEVIEAEERSNYFRFYSVNEALVKITNLPEKFPGFGSDQFAVSGNKSADGHVIQFEETHMPWANRFQNYEAQLITPGKLDSAGISWFGSPFFLDGFNDRITWSATWNFPNISDVYEEKLNPKEPLEYLYDGKWRKMKLVRETFNVKGRSGMQRVILACYYTLHGPVVKIDMKNDRALSVKLPNYNGVNYSTNLYRLMKARNLQEFKAVLALHLMPRWNMLYTDMKNIYWVDNATVARRTPGYDWRKPVPGWTSKTQWGPYFPLSSLPQILNPPSGFIQNCNNPPWLSTTNSGIDPKLPAPYFQMYYVNTQGGNGRLNPRGERLLKVLGRNEKISLDDIRTMAFDTYVVPADVFVPLLVAAYKVRKQENRSPRLAHAIQILSAWDRRSSKQSIAQTYAYFWARAYEELFSHARFERFLSYSRYEIDIHAAKEQTAALLALSRAIDQILNKFGKADVPWGEVNVVMRGEKFPLGGTGLFDVLHPDDGEEQQSGQIYDNDGWGHMMVVEEGKPKKIWSLLPFGESEDPRSPHYNDMTKLHSQMEMKRFWFLPANILSHTESVWGKKDRINRLIQKCGNEPVTCGRIDLQ